MTDQEISEVASKVLKEQRRPGFVDSQAISDRDFDGGPVIRVTARYERQPKDDHAPLEAMHGIRNELLKLGEDRIVFLKNEYLDENKSSDFDEE